MPMLVLASSSPRRRELLAQAGFSFEVHPAEINEEPRINESPLDLVVRLAREKAEKVYAGQNGRLGLDGVVLGADTTVTLDGAILGKPVDAEDAVRMLRMLSGRTHRVITGVAVVSAADPKGANEAAEAMRVEVAAEVTAVRFLTLSADEIREYVASGEPMDKAGAYAIQGGAAKWIPRVEGCYFNVVGLPLALVSSLLDGVWSKLDAGRR